MLILTSCAKTEILGLSDVDVISDTTIAIKVKFPKPFPKPIEPDTTRVPIGFNPSVEDWEQKDIEITQ